MNKKLFRRAFLCLFTALVLCVCMPTFAMIEMLPHYDPYIGLWRMPKFLNMTFQELMQKLHDRLPHTEEELEDLGFFLITNRGWSDSETTHADFKNYTLKDGTVIADIALEMRHVPNIEGRVKRLRPPNLSITFHEYLREKKNPLPEPELELVYHKLPGCRELEAIVGPVRFVVHEEGLGTILKRAAEDDSLFIFASTDKEKVRGIVFVYPEEYIPKRFWEMRRGHISATLTFDELVPCDAARVVEAIHETFIYQLWRHS